MANFMIVENLSYGLNKKNSPTFRLINLQLFETASGHKIEAHLSFHDNLL